MSSYAVFATGDEDQLPGMPARAPAPPPPPPVARVARRSTGGTAPSPVEVVPAMRPGWSGGKPPPGSLRRDIAGRMSEAVASFSDDEDYLRGRDLQQRHEREERARKRQEPPPSEEEEDDDDTEDEGAAGPCICDTQPRANCVLHGASVMPLARASALTRLTPPPAPAPMPLQRQVAAITGTGAAEPPSSSSSSSSSNVSTLMESAVREAFRQGIEQGKRMQLPQQCKTCAVRKERNRLAAKESRHKKRREAEVVITRNLIAAAADVAASRATSPTPVPAAPAPLAASARAAAGGGEEEELEPPPF